MRLIGIMRGSATPASSSFHPGLHAARRRLGGRWRSGCRTLPERLLDHREHSFEGRLAEIAARRRRRRCSSATRSAAGSRCAPRCGDPGATRGLVLVGATAGIEEPSRARGTRRGRRAARLLDRGAPDRGRRGALGAPAGVRGPVRRARRGAARRPPLRTTRARWPSCCAPPARACSSRSGTSCARSSCPVLAHRRRAATSGYADAAKRIGRHGSERARLGIVADAGHAAAAAAAGGGRSSYSVEFLDEHLGVARASSTLDAEARARAAPPASRCAGGGSARASGESNSSERRQPAGERAAPRRRPAAARRRCPTARRACSTGTRPARSARAAAERLARRLEAAARGQLHVHDVAGLEPRPPRARRSRVRRPTRRRRSGSTRAARTSASSSSVRAGLLDELEVVLLERPDRVHRLVHRPGAVGVDPQRRPRADRLAHRRHALDVVGQPDLQLEAGVARRARPRAARSATSSGGPAAQRQVHRQRVARRLGQRALLLARLEVEARDLLGGAHLRRAPPAAAAAARRSARSSGTPSYGSNGAASP